MHLHEEYVQRNKIDCNVVLRNSSDILFFKNSVFDFVLIRKDSSKRPFVYKFDFFKKGQLKKSLDITWENYERFILFLSNCFKDKIVFDKKEIASRFWMTFVLRNQKYFLNNVDRKILIKSIEGDLNSIIVILNDDNNMKLNWKKNINSVIKRYAFWLKVVS